MRFVTNRKTTSKAVLLHRDLLGNPKGIVDHINGDGLDCRRSNLRLASASESAANVKLRSDNSTGFKGVSPHRKKWSARIQWRGKRYELGDFSSCEEAVRAYDKAARELHGEFAVLNFPYDES